MTVDKGALGMWALKEQPLPCSKYGDFTTLVRSLMIITPLHVGTDLQVWLSYPEITQQKSNNMTEWVVRSSSVTSHCRLKQRLSIEVTWCHRSQGLFRNARIALYKKLAEKETTIACTCWTRQGCHSWCESWQIGSAWKLGVLAQLQIHFTSSKHPQN